MITASIHRTPRPGLLLGLLLLCLWPAALPRATSSLAQSGCAAPAAVAAPAQAPPAAPGAISLRYSASLGGDSAAAALSGPRLVFSRGADLGLFDPAASAFQRLPLQTRVEDIAVGPQALYLAAGSGGLIVADLDAASRLAALPTPGLAAALALDGPYAYLAASGPGGGLQIIDVRDNTRPRLLASAPTYGSAEDLAVAGGLAYLAEGLAGGIEIFDLANPADPIRRGGLLTPGAARGVAVAAGRAYIAGGPCGLQVVDVADPAAPLLLGAAPTGGEAQAVRIAGGRAYVAAGPAGLKVFDLGQMPPRLVAERAFGDLAPIGDIYLDGTRATLAAGPAGAIIVDIADPALPTLARAPTLGGVRAVRSSGGELYLAMGAGGLAAAAMGDSLVDTPRSIGATSMSLAIGPSVAGQATIYSAGGSAGLGVVQATPGGPLALVRSVPLAGSIGAILVDGASAYVAAGTAGVHLLDLSDPLSPTPQRTIDTPGAALDLARSGGLLYVADRDGLQLIDLATGGVVGGYAGPPGSFIQGVAAGPGLAYLADRGGLIVLDLSDPASPALLPGLAGFSLYGLAVEGSVLFAAAGKDGVLAFDLGDPAAPRLAGRYDTPGTALGVTPDGGSLLVADSEGGLLRLSVTAMPFQLWAPAIFR